MTLSARDRVLISLYLDCGASPTALADLQRRLLADPHMATAFADAARLDAWLEEHFRQERGVRDARAILEAAGAAAVGHRPAEPKRPVEQDKGSRAAEAAGGTRRPFPKWLAAVAAAIVVLAGTVIAWLYWNNLSGPTHHMVIDGRLLVAGAETSRVAPGTRVSSLAGASATVLLTDGSRATLDASSEAILYGRRGGRRQVVGLLTGGATFKVARAPGVFEVETPLGRVAVLGTEFSVRLTTVPQRDAGDALTSEDSQRGARPALAVAVKTGTVQVTFEGRTHVLRDGQSRLFAHAAEKRLRETQVAGRIVAVEGPKITVVRKKEGVEERREVFLDPLTKVRVETGEMEHVAGEAGKVQFRPRVADGTVADLVPGRYLTGAVADDGRLIKVLVQKAEPAKPHDEKERRPAAKGKENMGAGQAPAMD